MAISAEFAEFVMGFFEECGGVYIGRFKFFVEVEKPGTDGAEKIQLATTSWFKDVPQDRVCANLSTSWRNGWNQTIACPVVMRQTFDMLGWSVVDLQVVGPYKLMLAPHLEKPSMWQVLHPNSNFITEFLGR